MWITKFLEKVLKRILGFFNLDMKLGMRMPSKVEIEDLDLNRFSGFGLLKRGQLLLNENGNPLFFATPKDAILYSVINKHGNPVEDSHVAVVFQRWETPTKRVFLNEVVLSGTDQL